MIASIRVLVDRMGLELDEAVRMASLYPAEALGAADFHGKLGSGSRADFVHLSDDLAVEQVWIGGASVYEAH